MKLTDMIEVAGKVVLVRTDYNVPIKNGVVQSDVRLRASLPVINDLLKNGARKIVLVSHLGRPEGRDENFSLKPLVGVLEALVGQEIAFAEQISALKSPELAKKRLILLENLRFWAGEADNSLEFAEELVEVSGAEIFVQDGFAVAHRKTATTDAITELLPSYASDNFKHEYQTVGGFLTEAERPLVAIIGGAKISDKIDFLVKLAREADYLVIGGAMANVFLAHKGVNIGRSLVETGQDSAVQAVFEAWVQAGKAPERIILPRDVKIVRDLNATEFTNKNLTEIENDDIIGDIGEQTTEVIAELIGQAGAVLWNGNLGYTENPKLAIGSAQITRALIAKKSKCLIGGGDTVGFVDNFTTEVNLQKPSQMFLSTGGGASLELVAYGKLPGARGLLNLKNQL